MALPWEYFVHGYTKKGELLTELLVARSVAEAKKKFRKIVAPKKVFKLDVRKYQRVLSSRFPFPL